ncbi:hypothetical protein HY256_07770 [Candidatus Sumerlaeota bacterium]|nr:hypothetical protein [Candidatus Sumerlaeota bacterium]
MKKAKPHEIPESADSIQSTLEGERLEHVVLAKGQYSPDPAKAQRVLIYSRCEFSLIEVADVWMAPETQTRVEAWLCHRGSVYPGSCDAMYGTAVKYIWAPCEGELWFWKRGRLIGKFGQNECCVRKRPFGSWSRFPTAEFSSCHAFLSKGWSERGVSLEPVCGKSLVLAKKREISVMIDPTYDGLDLICDANWVLDLAKAVSEATTIPLKIDDALR